MLVIRNRSITEECLQTRKYGDQYTNNVLLAAIVDSIGSSTKSYEIIHHRQTPVVSMKFFIILLTYTACVFGALFPIATNSLNPKSLNAEISLNSLSSANNLDAFLKSTQFTVCALVAVAFFFLNFENTLALLTSVNSSDQQQSSSSVNLPEELIVYVAHFLYNPYSSLPFLSKSMRKIMNEKCSPQRILQSRTKYLNFDKMEKSVELHRLLKLHPILLNRLFNGFIQSEHVFKVLNMVILEYAFPMPIEVKNRNCYAQKFLAFSKKLISLKKYDCLEYLINLTCLNNGSYNVFENTEIFNLHRSMDFMAEWLRILYEKKNPLLKVLIKYVFLRKTIFVVLLTTQMTLDEFWDFVSAADIENERSKSELILEPAVQIIRRRNDHFNSLNAEEKEFILTRNLQIIQDPSIHKNFWLYMKFDLIDYALNSKAEQFDLKAFIIKLKDSMDYTDIVRNNFESHFDALICNIANVAVRENRLDLILAVKRVKREEKMAEFVISLHREDIEKTSDEILTFLAEHCLSIDQRNFTFRMEIIRRKQPLLRTLEDLEIFDKSSEKFVALAKFYSIETFCYQLSLVPKNESEYNSIIFDIIHYMDDPAPFVHEILMTVSNFNRNINYRIFDNYITLPTDCFKLMFPKYIINLLEPHNAHIISDLSIYPTFIISISSKFIEELDTNQELRKRFASPEAEELRSHFEIDFCAFFENEQSKYLSHEIVSFFKLFGLEFGGFKIDQEGPKVPTKYSVNGLKAASLGTLDNVLIATAMKYYNNNLRRIPTVKMECFGAFQLWRERNLKNFEDFAPTEICELFLNK